VNEVLNKLPQFDAETLSLIFNAKKVDLHGLTKDEARFELLRSLQFVDVSTKSLLIVHGYHNGTVLKNLVRKEFAHELVCKKIPVDSSQTLFVLDFKKIMKKN